MEINSKIKTQEAQTLVPLGRSQRLAALAGKNKAIKREDNKLNFADQLTVQKLPKAMLTPFKEAQNLIDLSIDSRLKSYPPGMQKKLFKIRYGSLDGLKLKSMKEIFAVLEVSQKPQNFNLIAHLNYFGNNASDA